MAAEIPVIELSELRIDLETPFHRGTRKNIYHAENPETGEPSIVKQFIDRQRVGRSRRRRISTELRSMQAIQEAEDYAICGASEYLSRLTVPIFHLVAERGSVTGIHIGAFSSTSLEDLYGKPEQRRLRPYEVNDLSLWLDMAFMREGITLDEDSYSPTQILIDTEAPPPRRDETRFRFADCTLLHSCAILPKKNRLTRVRYNHSVNRSFQDIRQHYVTRGFYLY